jgi:flagellar biosynthesis anti-sigma factor FlgM
MDLSINRVAAQVVATATKKPASAADSNVPGSGDEAAVETGVSLKLNDLKSAVNDATGIDQEKVRRIAAAIQNGQYVINPENIAKRLIAAELQ